jgi:hypothetical protein
MKRSLISVEDPMRREAMGRNSFARLCSACCVVAAATALATSTRADEAAALDAASPVLTAPVADRVDLAPELEAARAIDRTWLYVDDARVPAPLHVVMMSNVSYTNVGSPTRLAGGTYNALGMNTAQPGAMVGLGGEMGLFPHVSIMTTVQVGFGGPGELGNGVKVPSPNAGLVAGVRVQAFPQAWRDTHLVVSAGYLREAWQGPVYSDDTKTWNPGKPYGDSGAWAQVAFSQDFVNRVRLAATVHVEHVFADGRDPLDLMIQAGASARVVAGFRLGVEYVGQDLEEAVAPAAEGGIRHFVGPTASLQLLRDRLTLVAGPSFGLSHLSPELLGRVAASFGF